MEYQLDAIDKKIVQMLQKDGKMKIKEIAAALKMTNTPIFDRIKKLENNGLITGYTAKVDLSKLGFSLIAYCSVTLEKHHKGHLLQFEKDVMEISEIVECYHIAGLYDYLLKIVVRDMVDYQQFITHKLASIQNIGRVQSSFVMTELKYETVLDL